jgi:hypothetical protein
MRALTCTTDPAQMQKLFYVHETARLRPRADDEGTGPQRPVVLQIERNGRLRYLTFALE